MAFGDLWASVEIVADRTYNSAAFSGYCICKHPFGETLCYSLKVLDCLFVKKICQ